MERIAHLVFVAAVVSGISADTAGSQEAAESRRTETVTQSAAHVAAIGQSAERHAAPEARPVRRIESLFESSGLAGHGPFPSRGGPNDD